MNMAMFRILMMAVLSWAAAFECAAQLSKPEQVPAQDQSVHGNPPPARPSSQERKRTDLSDPEKSSRRIRARGDTGEGPATRYPERMPKVIWSDRNSFHPPTNHGNADPTVPKDARTRQE